MSSTTGPQIRALVVSAVHQAKELMASPAVVSSWDQPSALDGMTVGALCAHLVRAAGATLAYLDRTDPTVVPEHELLTPVTYFRAALEAPIHGRIREVSDDEARIGPQAMVEKCAEVAESLERRLAAEPTDRLVGALGGRMLTLDDFCRTRLIEVLTHIDDVAASIGQESPTVDRRATGEVIDILMGIARDRGDDWRVIRALSRAERVDAAHPVFPVL